jgi:hypothetical protein
MRFFTRELWEGFQDGGTYEASSQMWEINLKNYYQQLESLKDRLGERLYRFLTTTSLHDGNLLSLRMIDERNRYYLEHKKVKAIIDPVSIELEVSDLDGAKIYRLNYTRVNKVKFDFATDNPLFFTTGAGLGDWGYDEITKVDDNYLRHEIIFSSGTVLLIEFKKLSIRGSKVSP